MKRLALTLAAASTLLLYGCEAEGGAHTGSHDIKPKNGGTVVHLADHGPCMEVVFDGKAGKITLHIMDSEGDASKLDEPPIANIEDGPTQVTGAGKDGLWTFTHEKLKGHPQSPRAYVEPRRKKRQATAVSRTREA